MNTKEHWDQVYENKSPLEVSWFQSRPELSLKLIQNANPGLDSPIIDVGGGASTLVDCLLEQGYSNVTVLDIAEKALAGDRKRLGNKADSVDWYVGDVVDFDPPQQFTIWHDRALFHFLTDHRQRKHYVDTLKRAVIPGGQIIIASFSIDGPTRCSGLNIVQYDKIKFLGELGPGFTLLEEQRETHTTPSGSKQLFVWFRVQRDIE
jgi:SAM-dependent methyltransferase